MIPSLAASIWARARAVAPKVLDWVKPLTDKIVKATRKEIQKIADPAVREREMRRTMEKLWKGEITIAPPIAGVSPLVRPTPLLGPRGETLKVVGEPAKVRFLTKLLKRPLTPILGGLLAWNILTDWTWIGDMLGFLPKVQQDDIQKRALSIMDLINSAKSIVIRAQKERRHLSEPERDLIRKTAEQAERELASLEAAYKHKFVLFGRKDVARKLEETKTNLTLQIENFRQVARIRKGVEVRAPRIEGVVVAVHDGDTITLNNGEIVRLAGVEAPESTTAAGQAAKNFLARRILGKRVRVESDPNALTDKYGRRVGVVYLIE